MSDKEFDFELEDIIAEFNDYTIPEPRKRRRRTPVPAAETAAPPQAEPAPQQPVYEEPAYEEPPVIQEDHVPPAEEPPVVEIVHKPKHAAPAKEPEPEKLPEEKPEKKKKGKKRHEDPDARRRRDQPDRGWCCSVRCRSRNTAWPG